MFREPEVTVQRKDWKEVRMQKEAGETVEDLGYYIKLGSAP